MQAVFILCLLGVAHAGNHLRFHKESSGNLPGDANKLGVAPPAVYSKEEPEIVREIQDSTAHPEDYQHEVVDGVDYEELPAKTFDSQEEAEKSVDKDEADWDNEVQQEISNEEKQTGEQEGPGIVWTSAVEETWPGEDEETKKKWDMVLHAELANMEKTGNPFTPSREFVNEIEDAEKRGELNGDGKQPDQESLQNFTRELEAEVATNTSSSAASGVEPSALRIGEDDLEGDVQAGTNIDDSEEADVDVGNGETGSQMVEDDVSSEDGVVDNGGSQSGEIDDDAINDERNADDDTDLGNDGMAIDDDSTDPMSMGEDGVEDNLQGIDTRNEAKYNSRSPMML